MKEGCAEHYCEGKACACFSLSVEYSFAGVVELSSLHNALFLEDF